MKLGALLLCIAACGHPMRVYLADQSVPGGMDVATTQATLARAVDFWAGCGFDIEMGDEEPVRFAAAVEGPADALGSTLRGRWVEIRAGAPWAMDGEGCADRYYLGNVMRHELGHLVGLEHDPDKQSVMYYQAGICADRYVADACSRNDASRSSGQGSIGMQP